MPENKNRVLNQNIDDSSAVGYELGADVGVGEFESRLDLKIKDKDFIKFFKKFQKDYKSFYGDKAYNLDKRRQENFTYRFGRQVDETKLKDYNARFLDPLIYDAESYLKPIALSRLPDMIVKSAQETDQSEENSDLLSKVIDSDLKSRKRKRVLGQAFQHLPVYYTGIIKAFWNPEIGKHGDYDFVSVLPTEVVFDWTARSNNADDMSVVAQAVELKVEEWVMRFPDKEKEFYKELRKSGKFNDTLNENTKEGMNTTVKVWEIWFHWYEKAEGGEYERLDGLAWVYEGLLLKRMKNPYWDWGGEKQTFTYDMETGEKVPATEDQMQMQALGLPVPGMVEENILHNHLDFPSKPFKFLGYDQWGKQPLDETSRIEMSLYLIKNIDKRGRQMTEMWDRISGKHVWSTAGDLKKEDIEDVDLNDPDQDIFVEGDVRETHAFIPAQQPSNQMILDLERNQERVFEIFGVTGAVRGQVKNETATQTQIAREGDFTRADDLVDDTINDASEWMANWMLQFIKLFYTEEHMRQLIGPDGSVLHQAITRDMVEDGMEVIITASGVDKLRAKQEAFDMAKIQLIDPLSFYEDIESSDPKERAERLIAFMTNPNLYMQQFVSDGQGQLQATTGMAGQLTGQQGGAQQAMMDIALLQQGQMPQVPPNLDEAYVQTLLAFLESQDFATLPPEVQQMALQFAQQVVEMVRQGGGGQPGPQPAPQGPQAPPGGPGPVGPVASQPQPGNTQRVAIQPPGMGGV